MKNFFVLQLLLILCINIVLCFNKIEKRDVHKIILTEEVSAPKPSRSPRNHHKKPKLQNLRQHRNRYKNNYYEYSVENFNSYESDEDSYETASIYRSKRKPPNNHSSEYKIKKHKSNWKASKVDDISLDTPSSHTLKRPFKEHGKKNKPELGESLSYNSIHQPDGTFTDFRFDQNKVVLKNSDVTPYSYYRNYFPNNTYKVYEDLSHDSYLHYTDPNLISLPTKFRPITTDKPFFDTSSGGRKHKEKTRNDRRKTSGRQRRKQLKNK